MDLFVTMSLLATCQRIAYVFAEYFSLINVISRPSFNDPHEISSQVWCGVNLNNYRYFQKFSQPL